MRQVTFQIATDTLYDVISPLASKPPARDDTRLWLSGPGEGLHGLRSEVLQDL